jgi:methyl-accepting chemotaxis protein
MTRGAPSERQRDASDAESVQSVLKALVGHVLRASDVRSPMLREIADLSQAEVLAVGKLLQHIRAESKQQVKDLDELNHYVTGSQGGLGAASLRESAEAQELAVSSFSSFCDHTELRLKEQATAAEDAAAHARKIVSVAQRVGQLGSTARMVALNARVESSRLGVAGAPFAVLAVEIRALTDAIMGLSDDIEALGAHLMQEIPHIAENAQSLVASHREVGGRLKDRMQHVVTTQSTSLAVVSDTARAGFERADRIVDMLRQALEKLQFQDRIAQNVHAVLTQDEQSAELVSEAVRRHERGLPLDPRFAACSEQAEYMSHAIGASERKERLARDRAGDDEEMVQGDALFF